MAPAVQSFVYRIDAADTITYVSPAWLKFACDNDAPELSEENVLGSNLFSYVTGDPTRRLYELLLQRVRTSRQETTVPFNCDSPTAVRHMTLILRGLGGGAIELEGRVNLIEERPYTPTLDRRVVRSEASVEICSMCRRVRVEGDWIAIDKAMGRRRWLTTVAVPRLEESLCAACHGLSA